MIDSLYLINLVLCMYLRLALLLILQLIMENYYKVFPFLTYLLKQATNILRQPNMTIEHHDPLFAQVKNHFEKEQTVLLHCMRRHQLEVHQQEYSL